MLLTSGMAETKLSRVPLPTIDASTMRICMEFFYTGMVEDHSWTGLCSTIKVVSAGRFFLTPKLEELAISRLAEYDCLDDEESYVDLARTLSCAVELQLHGNADMIPLIQRFNTWLFLDEYLSIRYYNHLSEQALVLLLHQIDQHGDWYTGIQCTYVMFHIVVRWCISKLWFGTDKQAGDLSITESQIMVIFEKFLPPSTEGVCDLLDMRVDDKRNALTPGVLKILKLLAAPVHRCLKLINLDLSKIPGQILGKIIEPLDIVPAEA